MMQGKSSKHWDQVGKAGKTKRVEQANPDPEQVEHEEQLAVCQKRVEDEQREKPKK